jgi:hypothetical protein
VYPAQADLTQAHSSRQGEGRGSGCITAHWRKPQPCLCETETVQRFADASRVAVLRLAWEQAAEDLGIRVITEGAHVLDPSGTAHPLVALITDFGGGMHIFERFDSLLGGVIWERAQGFTELSSGYDGYDRDTFIEALCDWGWTGESSPPSWYAEPQEDDEPLGDMPNSGT